jgi:quinol monooxygenase YgiN
MITTRRTLLGGIAATAIATGLQPRHLLAQDGTPMAASDATPAATGGAPGYAIARLRTLPSAELNSAVFPDVMRHFLPETAALPGFAGYIFAFDNADPATSITLTLIADETAGAAADEVSAGYVGQLDPRFEVVTPLAEEGPVRIFATTSKPLSELPPFLHGTTLRLRNQTNAPDFDLEAGITIAIDTLVPIFLAQPGFVMYCWFERDGGRLVAEIWESPEAMEAGAEALAAWRDEHFDRPTASETTESLGTIGYAEIVGLG